MEPATRALRGNIPQALTHLALISAADAIARHGSRATAPGARSDLAAR